MKTHHRPAQTAAACAITHSSTGGTAARDATVVIADQNEDEAGARKLVGSGYRAIGEAYFH